MRRKASRAQMRARRKFAAMARARAKSARKRKRKSNGKRAKERTTMAKRKTRRRTKRRAPARRRSAARRRRNYHRGGHVLGGVELLKYDAPKLLLSAAYGWAEAQAVKDANFWMNKLPRPVDALGYTGNIALALYLASMVTPNRWVKMAATTTATIAAYKLGKKGEMYKGTGTDTIGHHDGGYEVHGDEHIIDDHIMGALDAEGSMSGIPYDSDVEHASEHV